jgi:hypothetical protein
MSERCRTRAPILGYSAGVTRHLRTLAIVAVLGYGTYARADESMAATVAANPASPAIEIVTIGNGTLVWGRHGHISACARYADPKADRCYHYALGDFAHPMNMVAGYFRGTRSFWAGPETRDKMISRYRATDRSIWVQRLPLTDAQVQRFIAILEHDILEEYKYYSYDHFHNNCTTRIRDILDEITDHALSTMDAEPTDGRTFRDLAREGFYDSRILLLVLDIAMGPSTDHVPTYWERMFLPQYMREAIEKRFGVKPVLEYEARGPAAPTDGPDGRFLFAFVIVMLTAPIALAYWRGRFERLALGVAIVPYVLLGTVLLFLAIISPLPYVRWNETILVFLPSDVLLFALSPARRRRYARGRAAMLGAIALGMLVGVVKQPLLAPLLWPLVPAAIVGFWPARARRAAAVATDDATADDATAVV